MIDKETPESVCKRFGGVMIGPDSVLEIAAGPREARYAVAALKEAGFSHLNFVTAKDLSGGQLEVIYRLFSYETAADATVRTKVDAGKPELPTVSDIFRTAEWHERETAEMFGIVFLGHPCPRRLLLPEGVEAPLRKDFRHEDLTPLPAN